MCVYEPRRWTIRGRAMGVTKTQAMSLSFSATGTQLTCFYWGKSANTDAAGATDPRIYFVHAADTQKKKIFIKILTQLARQTRGYTLCMARTRSWYAGRYSVYLFLLVQKYKY